MSTQKEAQLEIAYVLFMDVESPLVSHPLAQRNAFRCRGARLQSRLFGRWESIADTQPQLQSALLRLSAIISQYFMLCRAWLLFVEQHGRALSFSH
jgi:hypothetical protein